MRIFIQSSTYVWDLKTIVLIPGYVVSFDASDEFLIDRVISIPEIYVQNTHYEEEEMCRRLDEFRFVSFTLFLFLIDWGMNQVNRKLKKYGVYSFLFFLVCALIFIIQEIDYSRELM